MNPRHILISRTDSIGDVILTLPLAGLLKRKFPDCRISFLGMPYTSEIINSCTNIDAFINWQEIDSLTESEAITQLKEVNADLIIHVFPRKKISFLARKAGIPNRLGSTGRLYHWRDCNILVPLSRKRSDLHEAMLNLKLAQRVHKFKIQESINKENHADNTITISDIPSLYGMRVDQPVDPTFGNLINSSDFNIILHPRSKGSSREWGIENYAKLAQELSKKNKGSGTNNYKVFITGTQLEGEMLQKEGFFKLAGNVVDVTGRFNLKEFIQFINSADALIAGSTGPLHIASALGKVTIGLYPPIKPMDPGRWAPIGKRASFIVADKECNICRKSKVCECMQLISVDEVYQRLESMVTRDILKSKQS
ncbi:MAG: glycosyltransferase family 9 protein [Omnitrophica WOR_2 bacterium]|jgi:ADP-heptose:LPS heptosyltransferase